MDIDREEEVADAYASYNPGWTAPPNDPRYQQDNQMKYCVQSFIDYYRCKKIKGPDYTNCFYFRRCAEMSCPSFLRDKWTAQIEEDRFEFLDVNWEQINKGSES